MCLFLILAVIIITVFVVGIAIAGILGGAFILMFSDVIVCVVLVAAIVKFVFRKKNKKEIK